MEITRGGVFFIYIFLFCGAQEAIKLNRQSKAHCRWSIFGVDATKAKGPPPPLESSDRSCALV